MGPNTFPVTSREPRWLTCDGQVEIRGLPLETGVGVNDMVEDEGEAVGVVKLVPRYPQDADMSSLRVVLASGLLFKFGFKFRFRLRWKLMLKSSPVTEGRLPRLMEFRVVFLLMLLSRTRDALPSLHGVTLTEGKCDAEPACPPPSRGSAGANTVLAGRNTSWLEPDMDFWRLWHEPLWCPESLLRE